MQFIDLKAQYDVIKEEINQNIRNVLDSGQYMMGDYVKELEKKLADYVGVKHCVTCANGTDALQLALMAWKIKEGDAVFVPSFTFYSTAEVVSAVGATPIFVDTDPMTFNINSNKLVKAIEMVLQDGKLKPKVIISVDLFGQPANYVEIKEISSKYNLYLLEDGAQGFGGELNKNKACSFGDISTTSFFPAKPLGCYGDGGALFTNSDEYYNLLISLRVHGKGTFKYDNVRVGMNSRLDTIQAAILLPKLKIFEEYEVDRRNIFANQYSRELKDMVITPFVPENVISSWAQYTILLNSEKERSYIQCKLKEKNIPTMIYYPKPLHLQTVYQNYVFNLNDLEECERIAKICLSLPMHPYLNTETVNFISTSIKEALEEYRNGKI